MAENVHSDADIPYQPFADDPEERRSVERNQRGRSSFRRLASDEPEPEPKTYARAVSPEFQAKLEEIKAELLAGNAMSADDIEVVTQHGALDLLDSKRPGVRLQALKLLQEQRTRKLAAQAPDVAQDAQEGPSTSGLNLPGA